MATNERESRGYPAVALILFVVLVAAIQGARTVWADQPVPTLSINDVTLDESSCEGKSFVFTVTLSRLANKPVSVNYATSDGSPSQTGTAAVTNKDYVPVSGTLTFTHDAAAEGPNGSYPLTITVPLGNYVVSTGTNDGRAFTLMLSGAVNATISKAQGVGTMQNAALSCTAGTNLSCFVDYCGATRSCKRVDRSSCCPGPSLRTQDRPLSPSGRDPLSPRERGLL